MAKKEVVLKKSHKTLEHLLEKKAAALPQGFNETRFLQNCMTVLQDTKNIEKMEPVSIARTMLKGAFLGLDFFNGECYAIPYGTTLNFQTDYKGEIKLAKKYSINPIKDIYAKLVREGDEYENIVEKGNQIINFRPEPFNNSDIIGAFAVCLYHDGTMISEEMSKEEIEQIRDDFSKMPDSLMWTKTPGEAYKKTVLRRLCKLIEIDFDTQEQAIAFNEGSDMEFKKEEKVEESPFDKKEEENDNEDTIDVEYQEVNEEDEEEMTAEEITQDALNNLK